MTPSTRWQQLEALFMEAVDLDPKEQQKFLDQNCATDPELRAELEELLHSAETAPKFLDTPVMDVVKRVASESPASFAPGTTIGEYTILNLLASGGMGQVYLARDSRLKRTVALKLLSPHLTQDPQALRRFELEAQAASALNHPNILTVFEFGDANGIRFMATELVEGPTLRQKLAEHKLDVATALQIASQVSAALTAAHAGGITHRDIKPENIVIRPDGLVKLLDFGIAKLAEDTAAKSTDTALTEVGMVLGTLKYMSPEQARGVKVDGRSDIFSLGAVLYEMVSGKAPFEGETRSDLIAEILKTEPPPLRGPAVDRFPELQAIISKAMCKDRERRYQAAGELAEGLQALRKGIEFAQLQQGEATLQVVPGQPLRTKPASTGSTRNKSGQWRLIAALPLLLILIAAGVFFFRRWQSTHEQPQQHRLAILPFRNLKPDPASDFLGFSLADALTTKLTYVNELTVRPSTAIDKYRNQAIDPQKVASELHVDTLLTGSFVKDGDDLRISTQLVDIPSNKIIWRNTLDVKYDKLLTVTDRVSQEIISGLELHLSPVEADKLKAGPPVNARAYEYYLRGVDFYSLNDFSTAIRMLENAVSLQPDYAAAWAQLGRSYTTMASLHGGGRELYQKAQDAYERAIALSPSLIEPRVFMGNMLTDTGRVEQAIPLLRSALQTSPNDAEAHWELGYAYRFGGMLNESVAEAERARGFDSQVKLNSSAINGYLYLGQYDKFLQSLPANNSVYVLFYRGFGEYHQKKWQQAQEDFDRAYRSDPTLLPAQVGKALSLLIAHQRARGLEILHDTEAHIEEGEVADAELMYKLAEAYAELGDHTSALRVLQRTIQGGFFCYNCFVNDPLLQNIRNEPAFEQELVEARQRQEDFRKRFF